MKDDYINTGRTNQKQETRDKILKGAQHFINKGLAFSLQDVANKTGLSRATIYRYYSNVEVLAAEASLDIKTLSPQSIIERLEGKSLQEMILGVQDYFNTHATENENAFRKYLSFVIVSNPSEIKRGARRKKTLQLAFDNAGFAEKEKKDLMHLLTILMGIEPLIVTKDVSGLSNEESSKLLKWGIELILKGYFQSEQK
jgi:AcrR family transcriptional regulator